MSGEGVNGEGVSDEGVSDEEESDEGVDDEGVDDEGVNGEGEDHDEGENHGEDHGEAEGCWKSIVRFCGDNYLDDVDLDHDREDDAPVLAPVAFLVASAIFVSESFYWGHVEGGSWFAWLYQILEVIVCIWEGIVKFCVQNYLDDVHN